jgi:hypothetical protein
MLPLWQAMRGSAGEDDGIGCDELAPTLPDPERFPP